MQQSRPFTNVSPSPFKCIIRYFPFLGWECTIFTHITQWLRTASGTPSLDVVLSHLYRPGRDLLSLCPSLGRLGIDDKYIRMNLSTLSQVIYAFQFPCGLSLPTSPYFTKSFTHWWATPICTECILVWCTRLALLHCHHFPFKGYYYPYMVMFVSLPGELQGLRQEAWCIKLWCAMLRNSPVVYHSILQLY
jgi:hypothetical protein